MESLIFPEHVEQLDSGEPFQFSCHPGVSCFTECCRELELALSPYDVLRLKKNLGLSSQEFLDRHAVIEYSPEAPYPQVYLGMVDDGRASCPFVGRQGCLVYPDRPGACRVYPLGRAAQPAGEDKVTELFVLLREPHCQGFSAGSKQTAAQWCTDQALTPYNICNDEWLHSLSGLALSAQKLTPSQADTFLLALYNLDTFRALLLAKDPVVAAVTVDSILLDQETTDQELLKLGLGWLRHELSRS